MYLFICFKAIGGTGSSGSRSDKRCSMPSTRRSEMKLLSVMFRFTPCSRWLIVVRLQAYPGLLRHFLLAYTGGKTVLLQTLAKEGDDVLVGGI